MERAQKMRSSFWNRRKTADFFAGKDKKRAPEERSPAPSLRGITSYTRDSLRWRPGQGVGVSGPTASRDESCISDSPQTPL